MYMRRLENANDSLPSGNLRVQNQAGVQEIGSDHPEFARLKAEYQRSRRGSSPARLFALLMIAVGVAGWWFNWHLAETKGEFYIKACLLGPLGIFGGLLMLLRPEWAGPLRGNSSRAHKVALFAVLGLMAVASGIDFYRLDHMCRAEPHGIT